MSKAGSSVVKVAVILGGHGLKGWLKLKSLMEYPLDLADFSVLLTADGKEFEIEQIAEAGGGLVKVKVAGISDRTEADKLNRIDLFADADELPELDGISVYYRDLAGMEMVLESGEKLGTVDHAFDGGGHTVIEVVSEDGKEATLPYNEEVVLRVEREERKLIVSEFAREFFAI